MEHLVFKKMVIGGTSKEVLDCLQWDSRVDSRERNASCPSSYSSSLGGPGWGNPTSGEPSDGRDAFSRVDDRQ